jgi:hypothetical protein
MENMPYGSPQLECAGISQYTPSFGPIDSEYQRYLPISPGWDTQASIEDEISLMAFLQPPGPDLLAYAGDILQTESENQHLL